MTAFSNSKPHLKQICEANNSTSIESSPTKSFNPAQMRLRHAIIIAILFASLLALMFIAIGLGQLNISPVRVAQILWNDLLNMLHLRENSAVAWSEGERSAVSLVRAPRIILAIIVGGALAISGATLQALFRNPLVSPDVIGVSSASAFGGVLMIMLQLGSIAIVTGAFTTGLLAALIVMAIGRIRTSSPVLTIVLGGIVVSAFFNALVSLVTYLANPYTTLPSITFWLMGSFAAATWDKVVMIMLPVLIGSLVVIALRWHINILSLGDDEAISLGVNPKRLRFVLIIAVSLLTSSTVAAAGIIGWVGLVVPHLIRLIVGHDNRIVIPTAFLLGGIYTLVIDTLARTISTVEIPVGILTAMIGAPVFITVLIRKARSGGSFA
ncbi:putative ABC transporter permease protein [Corynebacterium diphtheriae subsp. lausannense]|nr:putative ABC transporter permease protein [Corynebacterium belfantii]SPJ42247.1 putative ABC transporter permease protein [Corynebacterium diphtheriae subsp. lausannense]STC68320.1 ABC transporter transmembrane protein [Corynebacterium diphtheriae]